MSAPNELTLAVARLQKALAQLEAAASRRRERDSLSADLDEAFASMQDDRSRLALELDDALARAETLETANREVEHRIETARARIEFILAGADPPENAKGAKP